MSFSQSWRDTLTRERRRSEDRREAEYLYELEVLNKDHARGLTTVIEFAERVESATTRFLQDAALFSVRV